MKWLEFLLEVPPCDAEAISEALMPYCYGGVVLEPSLINQPGSEAFSLSTDQPTTVKAYLPTSPGLASQRRLLLEQVRLTCGLVNVIEHELDEEDWAIAWKRHFKTIRIGKRLVVKPTWERYRRRTGDVVVELDPGMAFGTGDHPTTRACLRALEQMPVEDNLVVDLGTGSGILAIAAAKLGARSVIALDVDPVAVEAARTNCALNQVTDLVNVRQGSLETLHDLHQQPVDLVLANLTSLLHLEIAEPILRLVRAGGTVIASGIGEPMSRAVTASYRKAGASRIVLRRHGEWRTLIVHK